MAKDNSNNDIQQQARPCPKDCTKCGFQQHAFCAAQMSFYLIEKVNALETQIEEQSKSISILVEQINSLREEGKSGDLINPIQNITQ